MKLVQREIINTYLNNKSSQQQEIKVHIRLLEGLRPIKDSK